MSRNFHDVYNFKVTGEIDQGYELYVASDKF
jgi:hypothetical protein